MEFTLWVWCVGFGVQNFDLRKRAPLCYGRADLPSPGDACKTVKATLKTVTATLTTVKATLKIVKATLKTVKTTLKTAKVACKTVKEGGSPPSAPA